MWYNLREEGGRTKEGEGRRGEKGVTITITNNWTR